MGDPAILKWYFFPPEKPHFLERTKEAALSCGRLRFVALGDDSLGSLRVRGCLVFQGDSREPNHFESEPPSVTFDPFEKEEGSCFS